MRHHRRQFAVKPGARIVMPNQVTVEPCVNILAHQEAKLKAIAMTVLYAPNLPAVLVIIAAVPA